MDPNISALEAYAGKYEKKLFSTLMNGLEIAGDIDFALNVKNAINMTKLSVSSGATPYNSSFTAKDGLEYTNRKLAVSLGKREFLIEPLKYRQSWMSMVMRPGVNPQDIPFAAYVWGEVVKTLQSELNDKTAYFGFDKSEADEFNSGSSYSIGDYMKITENTGEVNYWKCITATSAGQTPTTHPAKWHSVNAEAICEGLGTILQKDIDAGDIQTVSTGVIDNAAVFAYEQFKKVWRGLPVPYRRKGAVMYCSYNSSDMLFDDFEEKVGKYTDADKNGNLYLRGTAKKCLLKPVTWMGESDRLICTPKENLVGGTDLWSDTAKINRVPDVWTMKAGIGFDLGFQIRDPKAVSCNDVA